MGFNNAKNDTSVYMNIELHIKAALIEYEMAQEYMRRGKANYLEVEEAITNYIELHD